MNNQQKFTQEQSQEMYEALEFIANDITYILKRHIFFLKKFNIGNVETDNTVINVIRDARAIASLTLGSIAAQADMAAESAFADTDDELWAAGGSPFTPAMDDDND